MKEVVELAPAYTYVDCSGKGYTRIKNGKKYRYKGLRGDFIANKRTIERINGLVIPPAWKRVWICPDPKGHIQCYGFDLRNRKQYIYHPSWTEAQNDQKFKKMLELGPYLPSLKRRISKDLKIEHWTKDKVSALALALIKLTLMRVGNPRYTKENKSYGLTTLKKSHVTFGEDGMTIKYIGKKGVNQLHLVSDKKLIAQVKTLLEIPGKNVFQYLDKGAPKSKRKLRGRDLNLYLRLHDAGSMLSVKSFRIWGATVLTIREMARIQPEYDIKTSQKQLNTIIDQVAEGLGNTRAVAKKYYIHPYIQELFLSGDFYRKAKLKKEQAARMSLSKAEQICLKLLV